LESRLTERSVGGIMLHLRRVKSCQKKGDCQNEEQDLRNVTNVLDNAKKLYVGLRICFTVKVKIRKSFPAWQRELSSGLAIDLISQ